MDSIDEQNAANYNEHATAWEAAASTNVGHKYLEKPAMAAELDDLSDKNILCVGVGSGEELEEILKYNPHKVVGIDISEGLLALAKKKFPEVEFHNMEMSELTFPEDSFDYIYSSLAFHYSKDWDQLMSEMFRVLKPGGTLLFSTHHPTYWSTKPSAGNSMINQRGVILTGHTAILPGDIEIAYYNHQDVGSLEDAVSHAKFVLEKSFAPEVVESEPVGEEGDAYEKLKSKNAATPLFYIIKAKKPA